MRNPKEILDRLRGRSQQPTYSDEYIEWLRAVCVGWLDPGNVLAMKYAIENLPSADPVLEIGSFCGLSTNVLAHLLKLAARDNSLYCTDKWMFEGAQQSGKLGMSEITHHDYRNFVVASFKRNVSFFSGARPRPIEMLSDEFFLAWDRKVEVVDVFDRPQQLGGKLSFVYVDGNHTYDFAKGDFSNIHRNLVSGGFILFDDSSDDDRFGLTRLMKEISRMSDYELIMKNPNYLFRRC